ncbi:hypothetical protein OPT61_g4458 [Boeremia exigua]|uniref:Uncharacterized protein n=1 Tax=Boeremia exigua TaxID=749465 RepID=A0ACC2IE59_9PLEO|nr:hypothetical protein OPT61_g4458 [Boeremia exigua]
MQGPAPARRHVRCHRRHWAACRPPLAPLPGETVEADREIPAQLLEARVYGALESHLCRGHGARRRPVAGRHAAVERPGPRCSARSDRGQGGRHGRAEGQDRGQAVPALAYNKSRRAREPELELAGLDGCVSVQAVARREHDSTACAHLEEPAQHLYHASPSQQPKLQHRPRLPVDRRRRARLPRPRRMQAFPAPATRPVQQGKPEALRAADRRSQEQSERRGQAAHAQFPRARPAGRRPPLPHLHARRSARLPVGRDRRRLGRGQRRECSDPVARGRIRSCLRGL